jgi:hypothetical protein
MNKVQTTYNVGDLVEFRQFRHPHQNVITIITGIVIGQNTDNNRYKIKGNYKDYWKSADKLSLLSEVVKAPSK